MLLFCEPATGNSKVVSIDAFGWNSALICIKQVVVCKTGSKRDKLSEMLPVQGMDPWAGSPRINKWKDNSVKFPQQKIDTYNSL